MGNKNYIILLLSSFIMVALSLLFSCANQEKLDEETLNELAEEVADGISDAMPEHVADNSTGKKPPEATGDMEADLPSEEELAAATEKTRSKSLKQADNAESGGDALDLPSDEEMTKTVVNDGDLLADEKPQKKSYRAPPRKTWDGQSKLTPVPTHAFESGGINLNRFYFIRAEDTAASVSQLVSGTSEQEENLKKWNKGRWVPGKMIFYQSAQNPKDERMASFYHERNLVPEEHIVQKGDWLSHIAKAKIGHILSWKELAALNQLTSPDSIAPGQKILVYGNLTSPVTTAQANTESTQPINESPKQESIQNDTPQFDAPPAIQQQVKQGGVSKTKRFSISKLIQQNLFFILLGITIILLLGILLSISKRKRARSPVDDVSDDIFEEKIRKK